MQSLIRAACLGLLLLAMPAAATLQFDLANDFSTAGNPFGPWELWRAPGQLFTIVQPDYLQDGTNLPVWADDPFPLPMHVPMWGRADSAGGYVVMHGAEFDRTGTNVTSAVWTSPRGGLLAITGSIWCSHLNLRLMRWQLWHDDVLLTGGEIFSDGTYEMYHPFNFAAGSGGAAALQRVVSWGDRIELRLTSLSEDGNLGESLGLRLHLSLDPFSGVPQPAPTAAARLLPPQPNPFNPCTQLRVEVARAGAVRLAVFDLAGCVVRTLLADAAAAPGAWTATWDGRDDAGRACPSGRYVARLSCDGGGDSAGLMLVR